MQLQSDRSNRLDGVKTQFRGREGHYRLMNSPDCFQRHSRSLGFVTINQNGAINNDAERCEKTWIRVSMVAVNDDNDPIVGIKQRSHPSDQMNSSSSSNRSINRKKGRTIRDKKLCFNTGLELFVYNYDGIRNGPDLGGPLLKRIYKGRIPICHEFNQATATTSSIRLLVGFSTGQIQLIDFSSGGCENEENSKEFNYDRLIDKTRVTCIRWLPNSPSLFLVSHASGQLYLYKDDLLCGPTAPVYQLFKQSEGVMVYTCKTRTTRNPIYKWSIGLQNNVTGSSTSSSLGSSTLSLHNIENECYSLNDFVFSPCAKYLACVSQDGFLRVFCYDTMQLVGRARSYYGGLTCVCWSPDGRYVVCGGEDDLMTVWSFIERKVVARGMGHKSWVSMVSFDPYYTGNFSKDTDVENDDDEDDDRELDDIYPADDMEDDEDDEILPYNQERHSRHLRNLRNAKTSNLGDDSTSKTFNTSHDDTGCSPISTRLTSDRMSSNSLTTTSYRIGSIGHDTQLCLWDLSDDLLKQPVSKSKIGSLGTKLNSMQISSGENPTDHDTNEPNSLKETDINNMQITNKFKDTGNNPEVPSTSNGFLTLRSSTFAKSFSLIGKRDKRSMSQRSSSNNFRNNTFNSNSNRITDEPKKLLGSPMCPRMNEVPILQPSVCKKISYDRLTTLIFMKGGFITACQEGYVYSWARP